MTVTAPVVGNRAPRPLWRSLLLLSRVSNLPTVWSNVLAGSMGAAVAIAQMPLDWTNVARVGAAASAFYTGGMFLNDAFDARFDAATRPERPIPRGEVSRGAAFAIGAAFLLVGVVLLWPHRLGMLLGAALSAAIVFYDARHKGETFAPVVMGTCRGLVYAIAAAVVASAVPAAVLFGGLAMIVYVTALTVVAKKAGRNARWLVPVLIAGISLLDALFILVTAPAHRAPALVAALGFPLTLLLQRWVPGD